MSDLPPPIPMKEPSKALLEKDVEAAVVRYAKSRGFWCKKFLSPNARAAPDRIFKVKGLNFFFIEFKRPGKAAKFPSDEHERAQLREHERIREAGGVVYLVDDIVQGKNLIDLILANANRDFGSRRWERKDADDTTA